MQEQKDSSKQTSRKKRFNKGFGPYVRYSSLGFQMLALILLGTFAGLKLDEQLETTPILTAILSVLSVLFAIGIFVKDLIKKK